jgi:adenylosuccinate lyase
VIGRYETAAIRALWSDEARLKLWTEVELAVCEAWHARGEISAAQMAALRRLAPPAFSRVCELEETTRHDVVAFVRALGEGVEEGARRHLHRGLTSSDVVDTALALALRRSLHVIQAATRELLQAVGERAREHKQTLCVGRTHGMHAEPMTFGLKLCNWYTELGRDLARLETAEREIAFGKLSGAVGSFSQTDPALEALVLDRLGLRPEPVATQVVPRDRHAQVLTAVALLGAGLERFATEIRSLQRTDLREVEEPFSAGQTGSSAMPHKRNPVVSERICGMARLLRAHALASLENVALWHERDISHSSVERVILPDAFHLAHTMLLDLTRLVRGLVVRPERMRHNLERTGGLVFSQNLLGVLLEAGLERQAAYAAVQRAAMRVWEGERADLRQALAEEPAAGGVPSAAWERALSYEPFLRHVDALFARAGLGG